MPRGWLRRCLPARAAVRLRLGLDQPGEANRWLRGRLGDPALWYLNRRSVAGGVAVGLFVSWIPIPLQMVLAACLAAVVRVHVPVSMVMVWFTNPLTIPPLLYAAWRTGSILLGRPPVMAPPGWSVPTLFHAAMQHWPTLLSGCLVLAILSALVGYLLTQLLWRLQIRIMHRRRQSRR